MEFEAHSTNRPCTGISFTGERCTHKDCIAQRKESRKRLEEYLSKRSPKRFPRKNTAAP